MADRGTSGDGETPVGAPPGEPGADRRHERRTLAIRIGIGVTIIGALVLAAIPLVSFFGDPDRVARLIEDAGPWGPIVFILVQIGQVFAAPIPGQVTGFVGGYLFGATLGAIYATIGGTIGCALVFVLARRLGRPFVERFVKPSILERFDFLSDASGVWVLLFIFLVPIFPDDLICYVAGLTRIPIPKLILVALVGRVPGYVVFSLTGAGVAEENLALVIGLAVIGLFAVGVAFWQRKQIFALARRLAGAGRGRDGASP
jgi:uncharacterized membrane protein YdjX (TVP38/TMEM64 family)